MTQRMELRFNYGYKGALCCIAIIQEESGWIDVFNDFQENMYHGGIIGFTEFLYDLKEGKYS